MNIVVILFILVALWGMYGIRCTKSEGFCDKSDVEIYDIMSFSYKCISPKNISGDIPKCRSNQIIMVAHPGDSLHCGTLTGDTRFAGQCKTNIQDEQDYTVTCPNAPDDTKPPPITSSTYVSSSVWEASSSSSTSKSPDQVLDNSLVLPDDSNYSNVSDPTTFGIGNPNRPMFGARYQTIVSNLIIQSKIYIFLEQVNNK